MRNILISYVLMISAYTVSAQSCFDRGQFKDITKVGESKNTEGQTVEQYIASFLGCQMPAFKASLTDGSTISNESLKGKVVVMYIWTLHGGFNTNEIPYLNKLVDSLKGKDVVFLAVCRDDPAKWDKRSEAFFHFKHIAQSKPVLEKFKSLPTIVIFDKQGKAVLYIDNLTSDKTDLQRRSNDCLRTIRNNL